MYDQVDADTVRVRNICRLLSNDERKFFFIVGLNDLFQSEEDGIYSHFELIVRGYKLSGGQCREYL